MDPTQGARRRAEYAAYAEAASRRACRHGSDEPALDAVLRAIGRRRRGQLRRLYADVDAPAAKPAPASSPGALAQVLRLVRLTPQLLVLRLSRPAGFDYLAGQHVKLRLGALSRTYSLVSAPGQAWLEFFIELQPGGAMSERLPRLRPGDPIGLGRAKGRLRLDPARSRHLMIATVTGIAPFVSLLREHPIVAGGGEIHVLHGASFRDELAYAEELSALAARHPGRVFYTATVSRPEEPRNRGWQGARGRVGELVENYLRRYGLGPTETALYACGQPQMVAEVHDRWSARGYAVQVEPY